MPNMFEPLDPIGPALNAFNAVEGGISNRTRNALAQMAMQKEKRQQSALQQYGQTRDMNALWKADPETAMAAEKFVSGMKRDRQEVLAKNIDIFDAMKGSAVNNPDIYESMYNQGDADFKKYLMKPADFAKLDPKQREEELFHKEHLAAAIKAAPSWFQQQRARQEDEKIAKMETPDQKFQKSVALAGVREGLIRTRPTTVVGTDPATNLPTTDRYPGPVRVRGVGQKGTDPGAVDQKLWQKAVDKADVQIRALTSNTSTDTRLSGKKPEEVESFRKELEQKYYNELKAGPGGGKSEGGAPPYSPNQPKGTTATAPDGSVWETDGTKWTKKAGH